jgi:predicted transcriptional regulator
MLYLDLGIDVTSDVPARLYNWQSDNTIYCHEMKNLLVCHFSVSPS